MKKETLSEMIRRIIKEEASGKIKIVVCDEHTLGYIDPETPNNVSVLSSSVRRGATTTANQSYSKNQFKKIRLANSEDFDTFRVSEDGYRRDMDYEYNRT